MSQALSLLGLGAPSPANDDDVAQVAERIPGLTPHRAAHLLDRWQRAAAGMILDGCGPVATLPAGLTALARTRLPSGRSGCWRCRTIIKHPAALPGRGSAGRGRPSADRKADLAAPTPRAEP
jgi:hypothetical protein